MTDRIDLDELADATEEEADRPNRGDWLWRDEDDADGEPVPEASDGEDATSDAGDATDGALAGGAVPHVPRPNKDRPVGIPIEGGGAGGGREPERGSEGSGSGEGATTATGAGSASGPHGGGVDDMTTAFTYGAVARLAEPARAVADASQWSDWVGIVGDVEAYVINKFQRDHGVDVDFFNGSGTGPGERLAAIDEHSMFFAERMVVVGVEGEDEPIAREADWEFVPLSTAAEKAGWELTERGGDGPGTE